MPGPVSAVRARNDFSACSGCSLCLLVCPVWRATRDPRMSPEGRAKGLQSGADATELAVAVRACTLCGACEPVCPERIDLVGMTLGLRGLLADTSDILALRDRLARTDGRARDSHVLQENLLLCGAVLRNKVGLLARVLALTGCSMVEDDGEDIVLAVEAGMEIPQARREAFLRPLRGARTLVVENGLWLRPLRAWLPGVSMLGLGEALSSKPGVRRSLEKSDLYVIEPRAYHADYERLVGHYDILRAERRCAFNLDLQRIAIPATARGLGQSVQSEADDDEERARWMLRGHPVERIVLESEADRAGFLRLHGIPVVHLAELADH